MSEIKLNSKINGSLKKKDFLGKDAGNMIRIQRKMQRHRVRNFSVFYSHPDFRILSDPNLLVRIAGESLASSVPEPEAERCQQIALGLQQLAPNH